VAGKIQAMGRSINVHDTDACLSIQEVTLALRRGLGVRALADTIHVYPTLAMAVQQAALGFYTQWPAYRLARRPLRVLVHRVR